MDMGHTRQTNMDMEHKLLAKHPQQSCSDKRLGVLSSFQSVWVEDVTFTGPRHGDGVAIGHWQGVLPLHNLQSIFVIHRSSLNSKACGRVA